MTARKKTTPRKRKTAQRRSAQSGLKKLEEEIPRNLRDYGRRVRKNLNQLERDLERAVPQARRRTARLIRDASHALGRLEERGEAEWRRRAERVTKEAQALLRRLERAIAPPRKTAKKKPATRKSPGRKKQATAAK